MLFKEYLETYGYSDWTFEHPIENCCKRPDYFVRWGDREFLFEVKERRGTEVRARIGAVDPRKGIKEEIHEARIKFREFKDYCCSLVIYNAGDPRTWLEPRHVFGAMLGDPGFTVDLTEDGKADLRSIQSVFLPRGGKMVRYKTGEFQNTTISSIVILTRARVPDPDFVRVRDREVAERQNRLGRTLDDEERAEVRAESWWSHRPQVQHPPAVVVCENPGAPIPLPAELFTGPYDQRFALRDGVLIRTFTGCALTQAHGSNDAEI
ncbi:MAG: hypothetical protein V3W34_03195 [Phycisphaerae bacterium]